MNARLQSCGAVAAATLTTETTKTLVFGRNRSLFYRPSGVGAGARVTKYWI